tara:strand:- start:4196 stop:4465 length:270 start_codon:yes stop_codon:yes gene_type:complete
MSNDNYDYDDYDKGSGTLAGSHIDSFEDDDEVVDFINLRSNIFDELEAAISKAELKVQIAISTGCTRDEIDRYNDELTLLMLDYEKFEL